MQHGDVEVPVDGAVIRLLAPDVLLRAVAQPATPEETTLDHEHDGELLLLPQVGAGHTYGLVRHVHHGDEHVHKEDGGDDGVEYEQEAGVHRVARGTDRLLRVEVRDDVHHVVEHL